jgi:hypothetical protein
MAMAMAAAAAAAEVHNTRRRRMLSRKGMVNRVELNWLECKIMLGLDQFSGG